MRVNYQKLYQRSLRSRHCSYQQHYGAVTHPMPHQPAATCHQPLHVCHSCLCHSHAANAAHLSCTTNRNPQFKGTNQQKRLFSRRLTAYVACRSSSMEADCWLTDLKWDTMQAYDDTKSNLTPRSQR